MEDVRNFDGNLEENRSFEDLRNCYGICVSPKAVVRADCHSRQQSFKTRDTNDQSLIFRTTYAVLRVDVLPTDHQVPQWAQTPSCELYTLRSLGNMQAELGLIRLNRTWRNSQTKILDLGFIVIRATPSDEFEPWWHSSAKPIPSKSPLPADWKVFLMCINWVDRDELEGKPRKAERFTMAMAHGKISRTIPTVGDWMSVEPKPVEVLVELT